MTRVLIRTGKPGHRDTWGVRHMKREAKVRVTNLRVKENQRLLAAAGS